MSYLLAVHARGANLRPRLVNPIALLLVCLAVVSAGCGGDKKSASATPPPPIVEVTPVVTKDVPIFGDWVATLDGMVNAQIQPKVEGYLTKQNYVEGQTVRKGQTLFEIDARPFLAVLDQAKSNVAKAEAALGKTEADVRRDTPLAQQRAIPQAQLDNDIQANLAAKAALQAAKAETEQARLNVSFTKVTSLIDGIAGIAKGQIGDLVGPETVLTTVSQVDPIKVYFAISEQEYLRIARRINEVGLAKSGTAVPFELVLGDGSVYPRKGKFLVADRQVDPRTGTIRIASVFPNPQNILRPGQFGRVRAQTKLISNALLVPQRAVSELQGSYQITVVDKDNKASIRPVKVGEQVGNMWVIHEGVSAGETVVADGTLKVKEGAVVNPKPYQGTIQATADQGAAYPGDKGTGGESAKVQGTHR